MSINSLNIQTKAIIQAALLKKLDGSSTGTTQTPNQLAMSKNGSIFNLVGQKTPVENPNTKDNLNNLNTLRSLDDLDGDKPATTSSEETPPANASEGRAQAAEAQSESDSLSSKTDTVEDNGKTVDDYNSNSQKLNSDITKNRKTFQSTQERQEAALKKDNQSLEKLIQEQEETQQEIDNAQHELDSLMASSSFTITKGGDGSQQSNPNQARITELQEYIGAKVCGMQSNGRAIYSLQRSTSKTLSKMNRTNAQFIKTQQTNTKALEKNESTTDKIIKVAETVEQISALVTQVGQGVKLAGQAMMAMGGIPFVGAALVAAGAVMVKVGTVVELVGNYGQAAANVTKTAAYAAQGNIMGAVQSAAAAIQTGAAAVKSTQGLQDEFGKIDANANANIEANQEITQKQNESMAKLANEEQINAYTDADGNIDYKGLEKDLKEKGVSSKDIKNAKNNAFGVDKNGRQITAGQAKQNLVNQKLAAKGFTNTAGTSAKSASSWGDKINGLYKGVTMASAMFGQQQNATNPITKQKGYVAQWDLQNNRRFQRIRSSRR